MKNTYRIRIISVLFLLSIFFPAQYIYATDVIYENQQNNTTVSGTIKDVNDTPVIGASVVIDGTNTGVISDIDGKFIINVTNPSTATLKISFIGFKTQMIKVGNQKELKIVLQEDMNVLEDVVIVGFGTQKKTNLTGSIGTTDSKTFEARPVTTAAQALQGAVPGLNIINTGGSYENDPAINIRGIGTIGQGSSASPLVLIDGIEGDLTTLNPQDIDNISVLKDAAASSIYGSRAPFGVILVTTKEGTKGKMKLNYNNSFRFNTPISLPEMMDSYTYALFVNDACNNSGEVAYFNEEYLQRIQDYQTGKVKDVIMEDPNNPGYWSNFYLYGNANIDWYKEVFKHTSFAQEHAISMDGGSDVLSYYLSASYLGQDGLLKIGDEDFKRYNVSAKINAKVNKWLKIQYNMRFSRENFHRPTSMNDNFYYDLARTGWPTMSPYDPNGYLYSAPSPALDLAEGGTHRQEDEYWNQQFAAIIEPIKNWKIYGKFNFKTHNRFYQYDRLVTYNHDANGNPYVYNKESYVNSQSNKDSYYAFELYSDYNFSLNEHNFKVMGGMQTELMKDRSLRGKRNGLILASNPAMDLTTGTDYDGNAVTPTLKGGFGEWAAAGFFGRINYDYNEKYLFEANLRYDGSSRFRRGARWTWLPSFSIGWNIAKESFFHSSYVNTLKLRASWGKLGNQNTTHKYPTYTTMPLGMSNGSWLVGGRKPNTASAPGLVSTYLTWEETETLNLGLDFGAFDNRFTGSFDIFNRKTSDMVGPAPELPIILGTAVPTTNNTELETYGFEISLRWNDYLKNGLGYSIGLSLSDSQTKILSYPNPTGAVGTYRDNTKIGEIWGYETIGIAKTKEEMDQHLSTLPNGGQNALGDKWDAGDIMYKDLNGDGKIDGGAGTINDHGDWKVIGNNTPRYYFGIDLGADWKGFDMRCFFQGVLKKDVYQYSYYFWGASPSGKWWSTGFVEHGDYFRADSSHRLGQNLNSYYPRPTYSAKNQQTQTRYLQNAAYIRLKNLQIGYTLPANLTQKIGFDKIRLYLSGENLWTGTSLSSIFDPELIDQGASGWGSAYPICRTISFGLSLNL
jgi:TonB-linked SusC/RagA family outer membrane protein|nr:TonB-dependent receptor [Bacteroides intestinalis]